MDEEVVPSIQEYISISFMNVGKKLRHNPAIYIYIQDIIDILIIDGLLLCYTLLTDLKNNSSFVFARHHFSARYCSSKEKIIHTQALFISSYKSPRQQLCMKIDDHGFKFAKFALQIYIPSPPYECNAIISIFKQQ